MLNSATGAEAQDSIPGSLKEYSYYIYGNQKSADGSYMQTVEATCFFVRSAAKLFLVSAKHVLTSWNAAGSAKPALYPDTLYVRIPLPDPDSFKEVAVDIRELKAGVHGSYYYEDPDVFAIPFNDPGYNGINAFDIADIGPGSNPSKSLAATAVVYGFPASGKKSLVSLNGRLFSSPNENINYRDNGRAIEVRDTINYLIKFGDPVQAGYSGAPVFLNYDGQDKWYFAGVISQGVPEGNYMFVVKPLAARDRIPMD